MRICISGGRIIDPGNHLDKITDLYIDQGRIVALGARPEGFETELAVDATDQVVCPGFVDLCARLREPGQEHKATIDSETRAAVASGITTLCLPPDTTPVVDEPSVVELIRRRNQVTHLAKLVIVGALTRGLDGTALSEMAALKDAGCVGVGNATKPIANTLVMRRAMEYAATYGLTVFLYACDPWLGRVGCAHEGRVATRLGLPGIPRSAETSIVARDLALTEEIGVRAHFCHVSTARSVDMIARAQQEGLPVTANTAAHQLHLTEDDLTEFNSLCHVLPPLRTKSDRDGLRRGVAECVISAICSDHQPHEADAKLGPFVGTEPGISALETFLPLNLRLIDRGMTLPQVIERMTSGPARILGIDAGTLSLGAAADICVFDPEKPIILNSSEMLSSGKNCPVIGWPLKGCVSHTLVDGQIVFSKA